MQRQLSLLSPSIGNDIGILQSVKCANGDLLVIGDLECGAGIELLFYIEMDPPGRLTEHLL